MRKIFPIMVFAAKDYMGVDSKENLVFSIPENDKNAYEFIRGEDNTRTDK